MGKRGIFNGSVVFARCQIASNSCLLHVGVSENSVALNPMVLLIIIPCLNGYFIGNIPYFQTNPLVFYFLFFSLTICVWLPLRLMKMGDCELSYGYGEARVVTLCGDLTW